MTVVIIAVMPIAALNATMVIAEPVELLISTILKTIITPMVMMDGRSIKNRPRSAFLGGSVGGIISIGVVSNLYS